MKDLALLLVEERGIGHARRNGDPVVVSTFVDVRAEHAGDSGPAPLICADRETGAATRRQGIGKRSLHEREGVAALEVLEAERLGEVADGEDEGAQPRVAKREILDGALPTGRIDLGR